MCDNQLCYPSHIAGLWSRVPRRPAGPRCDGRGAEAHPQGAQQVEVQHRHRQGEERPARAAARRQQHEVHGEFSPACYSYNVLVSMWDEELEKIAQRHADQCNFDHDCSDCRRTSRYTIQNTKVVFFDILMWLCHLSGLLLARTFTSTGWWTEPPTTTGPEPSPTGMTRSLSTVMRTWIGGNTILKPDITLRWKGHSAYLISKLYVTLIILNID